MLLRPFTPGFSVRISATASSAATALGAGTGETVCIYNGGSVAIAVTFGGSTATATVPTSTAAKDCYIVPPTTTRWLTREPTTQTYIAVITVSSTATVDVSTGEGMGV